MEIKHSKFLEQTLERAMRKVADIDAGEVEDFIQECVAEIAAHHVMGNVECSKVKDLDYWEAQVDHFEAGLKVAEAMTPGDKIFTAGLDPFSEDGVPVSINHLFYFVGKDARSVARLLKEEAINWIDKLRKDKGLLPFPD